MRFLWTFFWAILISSAVTYVLTSMAGNSFDMVSALAVAIILTVGVSILGDGILKGENEQ